MRLRDLTSVLLFVVVPFAAYANDAQRMYDGSESNRRPERLAFIVGISDYQENFGQLPNARADADTVASLVASIGVTNPRKLVSTKAIPYVSRRKVFAELREFLKDAELSRQRNGIAPILIFYFAGHGFTHKSTSYLVPSDAFVLEAEDPDRHTIKVSEIIAALQATKPTLAVVIVDACRDLAFDGLRSYSGQSSAVKSGIDSAASVPAANMTSPYLLYYSTKLTKKALDGVGQGNSPFVVSLRNTLQRATEESSGTSYRFFSEIVEATNRQTRARAQRNEVGQAPELLNNATAKLPIFTTEAHFDREKKTWDAIDEDIADLEAGLHKQLPPKGDARFQDKYQAYKSAVAEDRLCRTNAFIDTFGYSFFWRQASEEMGGREVPDRCKPQQDAQLQSPRPSSEEVTDPEGNIEFRKISFAISELSATMKWLRMPTAERAGPGFVEDPRLSAISSSLAPAAKAMLVVVASTTLHQSSGKVRRTLKLTPGTLVEFVQFEGSNSELARVKHAVHGFGTVQAEDLASTQGFYKNTFELTPGSSDLSKLQQDIFKRQLRLLTASGDISTMSIRYSKIGAPQDLEAAVRVSRLAFAEIPQPQLPRLEVTPDLEPGLIEVVAGVEYCQRSKPICELPRSARPARVLDALVGKHNQLDWAANLRVLQAGP